MNYKKIVREEVSKFFNNLNKYAIVPLEKYLNLSDDEKIKSLPFEYYFLLNSFFEKENINPKDYDIDDDNIVELEKNHPNIFIEFGLWLYDNIKNNTLEVSKSDYPTWSFFDKTKSIKNEWMVHFTSKENANNIIKEGFKKGVNDYTKLGLTTYRSNFDKEYGGYNFGYLIQEANNGFYGNKLKYGDTAVVFKSSGLHVYHNEDREPQTVFYGNTVKNINLIENINNMWCVTSQERKIIYENKDFIKSLNWFVENYEQEILKEFNNKEDKWDLNKINFYRKHLKQNPIKFKYALNVLDTIEKNEGKVSDKQKIVIEKAMRGESGNINYSSKN